MDTHSALAIFDGKNIRKFWHNNEWWFSVVDALTESTDAKVNDAYGKFVQKSLMSD